MESGTVWSEMTGTVWSEMGGTVWSVIANCMLPFFTEHFGNGNHKAGWKSNSAMEESRGQVATLIGARPTEITFTSGATEPVINYTVSVWIFFLTSLQSSGYQRFIVSYSGIFIC